jgi:hypothetical protein
MRVPVSVNSNYSRWRATVKQKTGETGKLCQANAIESEKPTKIPQVFAET